MRIGILSFDIFLFHDLFCFHPVFPRRSSEQHIWFLLLPPFILNKKLVKYMCVRERDWFMVSQQASWLSGDLIPTVANRLLSPST